MTIRVFSKNLRAAARGQAAAEFATVLMLLLILTFAIIQMGQLVLTYNTVCEAAREGARAAIIHGEGTGTSKTISTEKTSIEDAAVAAALGLGLSASDVTVSFPTDSKVPSGIDAEVVVTYNYPFKLFSFLLPSGAKNPSFTLTATSQMPVSQ
jgi:Flp pilus assembly protein TadG